MYVPTSNPQSAYEQFPSVQWPEAQDLDSSAVPEEALIANVSGCFAGSNKMQVVAESPVKYTVASIK
jgi:organic hydroperoxide reductase OsmC/OhrA